MRTEADLLDAFRALEDIADNYGTPTFDSATRERAGARSQVHSGRPRVLLSALAAAAAVIGAVVLTAVVSHRSNSTDRVQPGTSAPPTPTATRSVSVTAPKRFDLRSLWFTLNPISGVEVTGSILFGNVQQLALDTTDGQHWDLAVTAATAKQPASKAGSETIRIHGRPGYYGYLSGLAFATPTDQPVGLVWEYAPGAWATVVSADTTAISSDDATRVAEAVVAGRSQTVRVPLKIGVAPSGMRLQGYLGGIGGSRQTQHGTAGVNALVDFMTPGKAGTTFTVGLSRRVAGETFTGTSTTISERTAYVTNGTVTILVGDNYVAHVSTGQSESSLTDAQVLAVARSIDFASNLQDQGTWFDATVALP